MVGQSEDNKKVDAILESKVNADDPALFIGVVKDGKIIYQKSRGLANLQHQVPAKINTKSNIASVAKQFTALMVLQLSLEEKLSLDDDIRTHLPSLYPKVKEKILVRHLINHTSGIRDVYDLMSIQQNPWWRREGLDNDDAFELIQKQEDLAFAPGSRQLYSNSGYILLTKIIAKVTGKKFHPYSKEFFTNLGMKETQFLEDYMYVIPNQAEPYSDWGDGVWQEYPMITNLYGDGFLFTTIKDQMIYEQAIQNADFNNNILLMTSQKPIANSEIKSYGFGLELEDRLNRTAVHHSGATGSYHAQTVRFPEEKLSVFVMSNNSRIWSGFIADDVAKVFLSEKETSDNYAAKMNENSGLTELNQVVGQYVSPKNYLIRIEAKDDKLLWKNANNRPIELVQESNNIYKQTNSSKTRFGFYKDAVILFYPSGKTSKYEKIPYEEATLNDLESYEGKYTSTELEIDFTLKLDKDDKLMVSLPKRSRKYEVEALNRNELLISDYILKVQRDQFDRVVGFLLTTNRVVNSKFTKKTNLKFQPKIETHGGSIQVTTIGAKRGKGSKILLTKNLPNGNEIWSKIYGGSSYDKASSILETEDGYLIIGSTSSYGVGNYDMFVIKVDKKGKQLWQKTYGKFNNDYGYSAEEVEGGFIIKGTIQQCNSKDVLTRKCSTNVWFITIDNEGNELSNEILEEIKT
tara:strand:- start:434568 stop:436637 length:2070 start_codon:yes stop_codon:yes gene_type:complete